MQAAISLRATDSRVWAVTARLLTRIGQSEAAVRWWLKIEQARPLTREERRDLITAALASNDLGTAGRELDSFLHRSEPLTAEDNLLAAQYAAANGDEATVRRMARAALADSSLTPRQTVAALALLLAHTPATDEQAKAAFDRLVTLARDPASGVSLNALTVLGQIFLDPKAKTAKVTTSGLIKPIEIADRIEQNSTARPVQKTLALELRAQADPNSESELVKEAIRKYGRTSDEMTAALCQWLYLHHQYDAILRILPPDKAARTRELTMQRLDCLAQLGRYDELKSNLLNENPVLDPASQHALLAVVFAKLGQATASENEWDRAVAEADDSQKLMTVGTFAEAKNNLSIAAAAFDKALAREPDRRSAYLARLRLAEAMTDTAKAHEIAAEIVRRWPEDHEDRLREIYLRLLLEPSRDTAKAAEKELADILAREPGSVSAKKTMALALLREGRNAAALEILPQPQPGDAPYPVLAVAWASNGWKDNAAAEARRLTTAKLFPEERALLTAISP